jgi:hypothetical protein
MQRRKIPSLITTRCAGWHRAGGIHPRRRANRRPDNRDLDHPCRPRRRHQMEGPGTASNAAPALAILRALRQDGSRPRSQKQDLSGSRKSGSQWTRRRSKPDSNRWSHPGFYCGSDRLTGLTRPASPSAASVSGGRAPAQLSRPAARRGVPSARKSERDSTVGKGGALPLESATA